MILLKLTTKQDGMQPFQLWDKRDFSGRVIEIYHLSSKLPNHESIIIPDNKIICDFCNDPITTFPVFVMRGCYALCDKCFLWVLQ